MRCQDKFLSSRELCRQKTGKVQPEEKKKKIKLNLHQKGLYIVIESNMCSFCVAGTLCSYFGLGIGGHTH